MKRIILLAFAALMMVGCDRAMDSLNTSGGDKYVIISKTKKYNESFYRYRIIKFGEPEYYDYIYKDSINFNVGDTIIITARRVGD
jgi:hypothetical protein